MPAVLPSTPTVGRHLAQHAVGILFALWLLFFFWHVGLIRAIQENPFQGLGNAAIGVLCLWTAPAWQIVFSLILGVLVRLSGTAHSAFFASDLIGTLGTAGVFGMCILLYRIVSGDACPSIKRVLRPLVVLSLFGGVLTRMLALLAKSVVTMHDPRIYGIDCIIAPGVAETLSRTVRADGWIFNLESTVYYGLGAAMIIAYSVYHYRPVERQPNPLPAYVLNGVIGYSIYFLVPASGPIYAFHQSFPNLPPVNGLALATMPIQGVPNAMPSLHFASALLVCFNSQRKWARYFSAAFMLLTAIATVGLGEHYVTDLVVAVPFAVFIQCLANRRNPTLTIASAGLVGAWLFLILAPGPAKPPYPFVCWALTILSISTAAFVSRVRSKGSVQAAEIEQPNTALSIRRGTGISIL